MRRAPAKGAAVAAELAQRYREAVAHHKAGRLPQAKALYQRLLAQVPGHPGALHLLGVLAEQEGDHERSAQLIGEAIQRRPRVPAYHNNLGNALRELGRAEEAERAYRHALELRPAYGGACYNLGSLLASQGRLEEATGRLERALELGAAPVEAELALAGVRARQGRFADAEACCQRALARDPGRAEAHFDLGNLLRQQGRQDEALASFRRAVRRQPDHAGAYNNLGALLHLRGELAAARACLDRALRLDPGSAQAHFNRARLLDELGELDLARSSYERALALEPEFGAEVHCYLSVLRRKLCDWRDAEGQLRELVRQVKEHLRAGGRRGLPPLTLNAFSVPAELRLAVARQQAQGIERACAEARARCAFVHSRAAKERLRVGYVSPDFRQHAVGTLVHGLFAQHDREAVEVYAYSLVDLDDAFSRSVRAGCDVFVDASRQSPEETARRIHADGIDVLVDLAGYTTHSRTAIFALRPAPVQAHHLGYLDSMGADFLPYLIADARAVTEEMAAQMSEAVVTLPESFTVVSPLPMAAAPSRRAELGLPEEAFSFCSLNALHKLDRAVFGVWMKILTRVPGAVLWLVDDTTEAGKERLRGEAASRGVDPARILFVPRLPLPEYLARYRLADLFLDTFAYNAGATAAGALLAGLPVLTLPGDRFMSRMGASLCAAAGIPEGICANAREYEERAVELAVQPGSLAALRRKLAEGRETAPLFDLKRFARHLEDAYRRMWRDHVDGVGPRPIRVPPR